MHQNLGQMMMYVNLYDREVKLENENPTIGLVLCEAKNDVVAEYTLPKNNQQIFAGKYQTVLPSKEELQQLLLEQLSRHAEKKFEATDENISRYLTRRAATD